MNVLPLSKSTYQDFKKCARYAYNRKILKIQTPTGEAAMKGVQFHQVASDIIKGEAEATVRERITYPEVDTWLTLTQTYRPLSRFKHAESELRVLATRNLDIVTNAKGADLIGIMDLVWFDKNTQSLHILDFKTGRYENDNEIERHMYAALGKALYPAAKSIMFELYFVQSNRSLISNYAWSSRDKTMVIRDPHNAITILREDINPLLFWVSNILEEVEVSEGQPNPGSHCRNWYGQECFYLKEHCPAYKNGRKVNNA